MQCGDCFVKNTRNDILPNEIARNKVRKVHYSAGDPQPAIGSGKFWSDLEQLVTSCEWVIDRPRGSIHPRYPDMIYPVDYGYLAGSTTVDSDGIDIWVGSLPGHELVGILLTVDLFKRDAEVKLLLGCTPGEIDILLDFQNDGAMSAVLVERYPKERQINA